MLIKILVLVILIFINGVFSATEIAFLSINKYKLNKEIKNENKKAIRIAKLLSDQSTFLSAIQVAITISGFLASALAAESFAGELAQMMNVTFMTKETLTTILVIVITLILSYFTLVFGELLPKKIGLAYSYQLSFKMINTLCIVITIFKPVILLLKKSTELLVKLLKIKEEVVEEDDLKDTITDSNLEELEKKLLLNVFEFNDVTVSDVMTEKRKICFVNENMSKEEIYKVVKKYNYTRFPVLNDNDEVVGVLNIKDLIVNRTDKFNLKDHVRKPIKLKHDMIIDDAFLYLNSHYELC